MWNCIDQQDNLYCSQVIYIYSTTVAVAFGQLRTGESGRVLSGSTCRGDRSSVGAEVVRCAHGADDSGAWPSQPRAIREQVIANREDLVMCYLLVETGFR